MDSSDVGETWHCTRRTALQTPAVVRIAADDSFLLTDRDLFDCDATRFYIPTGNANLRDRAHVLRHERGLELLDTVKLAVATRSSLDITIDATASRRIGSSAQDYCALVLIGLLP